MSAAARCRRCRLLHLPVRDNKIDAGPVEEAAAATRLPRPAHQNAWRASQLTEEEEEDGEGGRKLGRRKSQSPERGEESSD